jgi:hypothetical protein
MGAISSASCTALVIKDDHEIFDAQGCAVDACVRLIQVSEALPQSLSAAAAARAAAASRYIADSTSAAISTHMPPADTIAVPYGALHGPGSNDSHSSSSGDATAFTTDSAHNTAAAAAPGVQDKLRWWGDVAKQAYEAIDGCLQGFEDAAMDSSPDVLSHMSASEADMVKVSADKLRVGLKLISD